MPNRSHVVLVILSLTSVGCDLLPNLNPFETSRPSTSPPETTPGPARSEPLQVNRPNPSPIESVVAVSPLASVDEMENRVTYRRRTELAWQEAELKLALHEYDAVQTHAGAMARLSLLRGSQITMSEDTLVIVSPSLGSDQDHDRAVVRSGRFKGRTKSELWVLTSAALLRLTPDHKKREAVASIAVQEGGNVRVRLDSGKGVLYRYNQVTRNAPQVMRLPLKKELTLGAPIPNAKFGFDKPQTHWPETDIIPGAAPPATVQTNSSEKKLVSSSQLVILGPPNHSQTTQPKISLRGRVLQNKGRVLVNGKEIVVAANEEFSIEIPLKLGANPINIQMIPEVGSQVFKLWTVFRKD